MTGARRIVGLALATCALAAACTRADLDAIVATDGGGTDTVAPVTCPLLSFPLSSLTMPTTSGFLNAKCNIKPRFRSKAAP